MAPHPQAPRHRVDGQIRDSSPPRAERRALLGTEGPDATGRKVYIWGPIRTRPPFPRRPLNPSSVDPADLSAAEKAEVVELIRKVQTDFDPEADPRGWDSVAVLVRGVNYGDEEIRRMGYPQLLAIFRTSAAQMRLQKTGSIAYGIATSTSSIVPLEISGDQQPPPDARSKVFRVGASGHSTKAIDVDGPLGRLEAKMRKELVAERGSESAAAAALVEKLYSLSAEDLEPMLRRVGCKASAKTISRSDKYDAWKRYRHPTPAPSPTVDVGPAALSHVRPSAEDLAADAESSGHVSRRVGGRGTTRIGKTATEKAAEDAADRFAREAGIELPPAE